jgi:hypothetical protein
VTHIENGVFAMKNVSIAAAVVAGLVMSAAAAQAGVPDYVNSGAQYAKAYHARNLNNGVAANGRCDGVSYGTGERSCGTATGGPVGGNESRN